MAVDPFLLTQYLQGSIGQVSAGFGTLSNALPSFDNNASANAAIAQAQGLSAASSRNIQQKMEHDEKKKRKDELGSDLEKFGRGVVTGVGGDSPVAEGINTLAFGDDFDAAAVGTHIGKGITTAATAGAGGVPIPSSTPSIGAGQATTAPGSIASAVPARPSSFTPANAEEEELLRRAFL